MYQEIMGYGSVRQPHQDDNPSLVRYAAAMQLVPGLIEKVLKANMTPVATGVMVVMKDGTAQLYCQGIKPADVAGCYAFVDYDRGGTRFDMPRHQLHPQAREDEVEKNSEQHEEAGVSSGNGLPHRKHRPHTRFTHGMD